MRFTSSGEVARADFKAVLFSCDVLLSFGAGELLLRLPLLWGFVVGLDFLATKGVRGKYLVTMYFFV